MQQLFVDAPNGVYAYDWATHTWIAENIVDNAPAAPPRRIFMWAKGITLRDILRKCKPTYGVQ